MTQNENENEDWLNGKRYGHRRVMYEKWNVCNISEHTGATTMRRSNIRIVIKLRVNFIFNGLLFMSPETLTIPSSSTPNQSK